MAAANFERLHEEAARLGVELGAGKIDQLRTYLDLLLSWNRRVNLTAITDPDAIIDKHFLDSLAAAPLIPPGRLIDVGSGAGLPGIPIAVARVDVEVTLLEATGKKAAFLRAAVHQLNLSSSVLEARVEQYRGPKFDAAISRATFAPAQWLDRARALVKPGGDILLMMGREDPPAGAARVHEYQLARADFRRIGRYAA
jgi:16S rRNA (guanine527-N7)-methyltransferase